MMKPIPAFIESWKDKANKLKLEVFALYLAYKDPRTPWYARLAAICVAAYAFSPIDLIPDPIPVLGYLDDLVLLPLGVLLVLKLIPPEVMADCRRQAQESLGKNKPVSWAAAGAIVLVWLITISLLLLWLRRILS